MKIIRFNIYLLFFIPLILNSCFEAQNEESLFSMNELITLKFNETVHNHSNNMEILFSNIISESRCPEDCQCYIAGKAQIEIECYWDRSGGKTLILEIPDYVNVNTEGHTKLDTLGYKFTLMQLDPYPNADFNDAYKNEVYEAIIHISKNN